MRTGAGAVRERGGNGLIAVPTECRGRRRGRIHIVRLRVCMDVVRGECGGKEGHAGRDGRGGVLVDGVGQRGAGGVVVRIWDHRERVAQREGRAGDERRERYRGELERRRRIREVEGVIGVATHRRLQLGGD